MGASFDTAVYVLKVAGWVALMLAGGALGLMLLGVIFSPSTGRAVPPAPPQPAGPPPTKAEQWTAAAVLAAVAVGLWLLVSGCATESPAAVVDASQEAAGETLMVEVGPEAHPDAAPQGDAPIAPEIPIDTPPAEVPIDKASGACPAACLEWDPGLGYCIDKCTRDFGARWSCRASSGKCCPAYGSGTCM